MSKQLKVKNQNKVRPENIKKLLAWVKINGAWNKRNTPINCSTCRKIFFAPPSAERKYCSRGCYIKDDYNSKKIGKLAPNWKGGVSSNNECADCGKKISYASTRCKSCAAKIMPHTQLKVRPWLRTPEIIKKVLRRRTPSSLEVKFQSIIDKYHLPYRFVGNGEFLIDRKNPDFININGEKKAIEVYARKHKEKMRNTTIGEWKKERQSVFAKYGWEVIFFDEVELNEENVLKTLKGGDSNF